MNSRRITTRRNSRGAALIYMFFMALFLGVSSVSFLSITGDAAFAASLQQAHEKVEFQSEAVADLAEGRLAILANKARASGNWNEVINVNSGVVKDLTLIDGIVVNASVEDLPNAAPYYFDPAAIEQNLQDGQQVEKEYFAMLRAEASTGVGGLRFTETLTRRVSHKATFFGVELGGNVLFVLDRSGSMDWASQYDSQVLWFGEVVTGSNSDNYASRRFCSTNSSIVSGKYMVKRIHVLQTEGVNALKNLAPSDQFAMISFGGTLNKHNKTFFPSIVHAHEIQGETGFVQANAAHVGQIAWKPRYSYPSLKVFKAEQLNVIEKRSPSEANTGIGQFETLIASGSTPVWSALKMACADYGTEPTQLILLADGEPNEGNKTASKILADFPGWYAPLRSSGCKLYCIYIGTDYKGAQFMQQLAFQNGGEYVAGSK